MNDSTPTFAVVRGNPDAEQLAVLTTVLLRAGGDEAPSAPESAWRQNAKEGPRVLHPGPGVWQRSLRR